MTTQEKNKDLNLQESKEKKKKDGINPIKIRGLVYYEDRIDFSPEDISSVSY